MRNAVPAAQTLLLAAMFVLLAGCAISVESASHGLIGQPVEIEVFVREGCPHCVQAKAFLAALQVQRPELNVVIRDVNKDIAALDRLKSLAEKHEGTSVRVPAFAVGGQLIIGFSAEAGTGKLILDSLDAIYPRKLHSNQDAAACAAGEQLSCADETASPVIREEVSAVSVLGYSVSLEQSGLPLFALAMGLLDGFNPCSMWVLILMISLLAPMQNRRRMLAIGGTFVAVQGLAYFIFMAAWLNLFLLIGLSRLSEIIIAVLALVAGAINLKDFWRYGWGYSLSIPDAAKPGIYARMRHVLQARSLAAALLGVLVLAILVQIVELMCTSGLPALFTRILTMQNLSSLSYYGYLALYDLAYMLDDVIVLGIGVFTLSQRRLREKQGRWLKLISGLVMLGLGVYLLWPSHLA
jgi:glutaredoxin